MAAANRRQRQQIAYVRPLCLPRVTGYWALEDTSGADATGRGNTLTALNTPTTTTGINGNAASLASASSQGYTRADPYDVKPADYDFAFWCWVKFTTTADCYLMSKFAGRSEYILNYAAGSGGFRFTVNTGNGNVETAISWGNTATTGTWYFVICWHDALRNTINMQINNGAVISALYGGGIGPTNGNLGIGTRNGTTQFLNGAIDECGFALRAVPSVQERERLYWGGAGKFFPFGPSGAETFSVIRRRTIISGSGSTDWIARPVLCDLGTGTWAMVYRVAAQHTNLGDGRGHIRFSTDQGETWTAEDTFTDGSAVSGAPFTPDSTWDESDPLLIKAPNGDLLLHFLEQTNAAQHGTKQRRSTDGGKTWTSEGIINSDATISGGQSYAIVGTDIYIAVWSDPGADNTAPFQSQLYKSTNNGTSWSKVSDITSTAENTDEPGIVYLGSNTLLAVLRDSNQAKTYTRVSTDLGATWGTLTDATATFSGVVQRPRLKIFGSTLVLYGRDRPGSTMWTALWKSTDNGATWSVKYLLNPVGSTDNGYCDILARSDGTYYMVNYDGNTVACSIVDYVFTL